MSVTHCVKCGKALTHPKHIDGIGDLGSECYEQFAGLEKAFSKFGVWLDAAHASAMKNAWNNLGIKYDYEFRDADNIYGIEYRFTFAGFKQANRKPANSNLTFKQIRANFAAQLQAKAAERHEKKVVSASVPVIDPRAQKYVTEAGLTASDLAGAEVKVIVTHNVSGAYMPERGECDIIVRLVDGSEHVIDCYKGKEVRTGQLWGMCERDSANMRYREYIMPDELKSMWSKLLGLNTRELTTA